MSAAVEQNGKDSELDGAAPDSTDYSNYFCTYSYIYHQKDMLEDHKRTGAYFQAIIENKAQFHDKVVLDVGTGSGILAIFAAKAGAKTVYAVEATSMAQQARRLVAHNRVGDVVKVIQGTIESISLPEKVDIIISEWMGYFLLRESMLDSVLVARDKWLKPGGALYPSHAAMYLAPIATPNLNNKLRDFQGSMEGWAEFLHDMRECYGVDLGALSDEYRKEQKEYYLHTSQWTDIHPAQLKGPPSVFKTYDLHTLTLEELKAPLVADVRLSINDPGPVEALCGFFDVWFRGSKENPADVEIRLGTGPDPTGATHWGQQSFYCHPPIDCERGDKVVGSIRVTRQRENQRLLEVNMELMVEGGAAKEPRRMAWKIE